MPISRRSMALARNASRPRSTSGFRKVDLKRAIDGAMRTGMNIGAVDIRPDGTITIRTVDMDADEKHSVFEQWEDRL